ncbi:MAG: hypothetical protein WAM14_10425, partial [Candidatus Nitrosopolaris sp.]
IEREKGLQETYLGFPFLVGNVNPEFYVRGPLILFPINLEFRQESKQPGWYIAFPEDGKPILNRALIEALKKNGGPSLTDSFADELEDLFNKIEDNEKIASSNVEATFVTGLIKLLKENEFPLDYANSNLDNVSIFEPLAVSNGKVCINDILIENQKLHLENLKVMGIFQQTESAIYGDYVELLKNVSNNGNNFGIIGTLLQEADDRNSVSQVDHYDNNPLSANNLVVLRRVLVKLSFPKIISESKKSQFNSLFMNKHHCLTKHFSIIIDSPVTVSCPFKLKLSVKYVFIFSSEHSFEAILRVPIIIPLFFNETSKVIFFIPSGCSLC